VVKAISKNRTARCDRCCEVEAVIGYKMVV
jgi:hypothetical protein